MKNYINYLRKKPMFLIMCSTSWDRGCFNNLISKWIRTN